MNRLEKLVIWKFIHDTFLTSSPTLFSLSLIYLIYIHSKNFYPINIRQIFDLQFPNWISLRNLDWRKIKYIYIDERIKFNEGKNIQTFHTRERSMEKNYFSIIFHHTDRNNKREKISFYLYITYVIYIFLIIPIFTYLYRQVRNTKYIQYKYTSCHHSIFLPSP